MVAFASKLCYNICHEIKMIGAQVMHTKTAKTFSLRRRKDVDMTEGNITRHIISFALLKPTALPISRTEGEYPCSFINSFIKLSISSSMPSRFFLATVTLPLPLFTYIITHIFLIVKHMFEKIFKTPLTKNKCSVIL